MNKIALLIGISDYSKVSRLKNLNGCKNDLIFIEHILNKYCGYNDIAVLSNNQAVSKNIKIALNHVVTSAKKGDSLLIYFTGHGSHVYDVGIKDEYDGLDEVLCPYDMDWNKNYISDDYLWDLVSQKLNNEVYLDIILDSCFSGGMLKGDNEYAQNKYLEIPFDKQLEFDPENMNNIINRKLASNYKQKANVSYWLSCGENEKSGQGFNPMIGCDISYFTYSLCQNIKNHNGQISRQALYSLIQQDFINYSQSPQLLTVKSNKLYESL